MGGASLLKRAGLHTRRRTCGAKSHPSSGQRRCWWPSLGAAPTLAPTFVRQGLRTALGLQASCQFAPHTFIERNQLVRTHPRLDRRCFAAHSSCSLQKPCALQRARQSPSCELQRLMSRLARYPACRLGRRRRSVVLGARRWLCCAHVVGCAGRCRWLCYAHVAGCAVHTLMDGSARLDAAAQHRAQRAIAPPALGNGPRAWPRCPRSPSPATTGRRRCRGREQLRSP
jgi:hypothetical protein